jgi:DNA (cytosine-5)-methyltransferase 1
MSFNIKTLTISTDCSGIEAPIQALLQLKINYKQLWSCDIDPYTRLSCEANYCLPQQIFTDMLKRNNKILQSPDLYVIGFPCQPYSLAGKRLGTMDPRSNIIYAMVDTIQNTKPKTFILENVKGFVNIQDGNPYRNLINVLSKEYHVYPDVYNTKNYGLPQNRERIYIIGIRKNIQKKQYIKPKEVKMKPLKEIIDNKIKGTITKYNNLGLKIRKDVDYNIINDLFKKDIHIMYNKSPTIVTLNYYYIIYELQRIFIVKELLQLQGFPKNFKQVVSKTQILKQIGNSMSVNVLKVIIKEILKCI